MLLMIVAKVLFAVSILFTLFVPQNSALKQSRPVNLLS